MSESYKDVTFVVQGPITYHENENVMIKCIKSIKNFYPDASIIVSTWGENIFEIESNNFIANNDPGQIETKNKYFRNYNRMLVSTKSGLSQVKTKYAAKIRSDFWFKNYYPILENYKIKLIDYPNRINNLRGRILMCMYRGHYRLMPYFISDWFHFGLAEDLISFWDVPLIERQIEKTKNISVWNKPFQYCDVYHLMDYEYHSEQQLCIDALKRKNVISLKKNISYNLSSLIKSYLTLGKFLLVVPRYDLQLISYKHQVLPRKDDLYIWDMAIKCSTNIFYVPLLFLLILIEYFRAQYNIFKSLIKKYILCLIK